MKRLQIYTAKLSDFSIPTLNELAAKMPCPEPTPTNPATLGFIKPFEYLDDTTDYVENINGYGYSIVQIKEKRAKRKQVTALLKAKLKKDRDNGIVHSRKEMKELRKQIEIDCIKTELPEETNIICVFDVKHDEIWLSTSNKKARDRVKDLLISIPIQLMERSLSINIEDDLTNIINEPNILPEDMDLGHCTSMKRISDKSTVRYRAQDLANDEVETNIQCFKLATQLELDYKSSVKFTLNATQEITGIKFSYEAVEKWLDFETDTSKEDELDAAKTNVNFTITLLEHLLPNIFGIFNQSNGSNDFQIT